MSKEAYFAMIDKARAEKKTKASKQELIEMLKENPVWVPFYDI